MTRTALLVLAVLYASNAIAQTQSLPIPWHRTTEVYVSPVQPRILENAPINMILGVGSGRGPQTPGVWNRVDLKPWGVAADAKWAELGGLLVVTHGVTFETATLWISFRRPGDVGAACSDYIGQTVEALIGSGQRSTMTVTVPLVNGEFEWCFNRSSYGIYPANSSYAANLIVQKWGR